MANQAWIEGAISIEAVLRSGSRKVQAVYAQGGKWSRRHRRVIRLAEAAGIPVQQTDDDFINEKATGRSHGGIIAAVGKRKFLKLENLVASDGIALVVMLDGVEDPFNFGQSVRALYAAGVAGLVVRPRNWLSAAGVVARASAGASEWMPMAVARDVAAAASFFRAKGLRIACTAKQGSVSIYDADLAGPLFLLIGGEKRGVTRSFVAEADLRLRIPYQRPCAYSLGAAASAAIISFEIMRQRKSKEVG
jgi:23S rRNA (guanosine2251-2'-O)-methyltransferase